VSTADYIRLTDGVRFNAAPGPADSLLTTAPPAAFGFLGPTATRISIEGSFLQVPEGQTLSVVGGDAPFPGEAETVLKITGATLAAPSGRVQIASVASAGEVAIPDLDVGSFASLGRSDISGSFIDVSDVSGIGGGSVKIRGGQLFMDGSTILSSTVGDVDGAPVGIDIQVADTAELSTFLQTATSGAGRGGDIQVTANGSLTISGSFLLTETSGSGSAGTVGISAASLSMNSGAGLLSQTFGDGQGGNVNMTVGGSAEISGAGTSVATASFGAGRPGDITGNFGAKKLW
jgi:hypothetical protein